MIKVERGGIGIENVPAQGKDLGTDRDHPLLHILVVKGDATSSALT